jgi:hypothetical protein
MQKRLVALGLVVSCGFTFFFQQGYRQLTGILAHREPAYQYLTGFFQVAIASAILQPGDADDPRVAEAVVAQSRSSLPFTVDRRADQIWSPEGLVQRLQKAFHGDDRAAEQAAHHLASAAIRRDPLGFLRLGMHNYLDLWRRLRGLRWILDYENGSLPPRILAPFEAAAIASAFHTDVSNQGALHTLTRRYHIRARAWYLFLLAVPVLTGLAFCWGPANRKGMALLFGWTILLLGAAYFGGAEPVYRYLHPFSFPGLAACAVLGEKLTSRYRPRAADNASTR